MPQPSVRNGYTRVLLFILPYLFIVGLLQLASYLVLGIDILSKDFDPEDLSAFQLMIIQLFGLMGTIAVVYLFRRKLDNASFLSLGFSFKNKSKDLWFGLALGALIMGTLLVLLLLTKQVRFTGVHFDVVELLQMLLIFVFVAFSEEILMRGYVLNNFMASSNKYLALAVSAILFALMHAANPNINFIGYCNLFLAGIALGIVYIFTKNLWFAIAFHFSWNFFQALLGFRVSGMDQYSLFEISILENNSFNGGEFGLEGSVIALVFELITIVGLFLFYRNKTQPLKENTYQAS